MAISVTISREGKRPLFLDANHKRKIKIEKTNALKKMIPEGPEVEYSL
jgi:hypothetical protein